MKTIYKFIIGMGIVTIGNLTISNNDGIIMLVGCGINGGIVGFLISRWS